jgi:trigger factor
MKTQLENLEECKVKLILEFDKTEASKAYSFVIKEMSKGLKVSGFIPGKIPKSIVEERFGKRAVEMQAIEKILADNLQKALVNEKLDLISKPALENTNFDFENSLNVSLLLELRPNVTLSDYKGIEVEVPKSELKDVSIESLLINLSKEFAPLEELAQDAIIEEGDVITMDFEGSFPDGEQMPDNKGKDVKIVVSKDAFAPGVFEKLLGMKAGEAKEIETVLPQDYFEKKFAGKKAIFKISVSKVERKNSLPLDDELAKKAGLENLDALKESLKLQIENTKKSIERSRSQAILLEQILLNSPVEIPNWLIEREAKMQVKMQGGGENQEHDSESCDDPTHDHSHDHNEEDKDIKLTEEQILIAGKRLKFNLVLAEIARKEGIQIVRQELEAYVQAWLQNKQLTPQDIQALKKQGLPPELVSRLSDELLFQKITNWLVDSSKVKLIEETEENLKKLESIRQELTN